ncbi:MAG: glycosyltransferase [Clostridia bacterium]|nr:glycosyltransferase [Clostridia bacterium]
MDLISIIVPVYKVEKYLKECIDSILNQTYKNFELILIDDGSPDNSGKICDEYAEKDNRIKVIHKENGGVSSARNTGLDNTSGEYITFIDSDDFVDKRYLEVLYSTLKENDTNISICRFAKYTHSSFIIFNEIFPEKINISFNDKYFLNFFARYFSFKNNIFGSACRTLFKKDIINNFRFSNDIKISEDLLFIVNVVYNSQSISFTNEALYFYRIDNTSASTSYKKNFLKSQCNLSNELTKLFSKINNKYFDKILKRYKALLCYYLLSNEIKFRKSNVEYKQNLKEIRKSELYKHFKLFSGIKILKPKAKIKFFIIWFIAKTRIFG